MAHVSIISSQSGEQIFEGAPRYIGAYLKPGYLEFQAIGSPTAISWHVGDYVVYPRTGKTYRLYRTPQIAEQGNTRRYGAAFLYENVQFFDDSKRLELCPFTDLVPGDNTIHFSTQNVVSFFGKPLNVAERVQACLENQYGAGTWEVRIVTTTDPDLLELLDTEVEFSVSGASCQQALDKVYELWNGLGWIHTVENGVNVITIGASNVRTNANTTVPFAYDDGLVRVERSIANVDEIGTRLFAYGSMKNMDATYYRGLDIKDAESVDIEHLMIPLANWGLTDNKPDARKAFIEDAAAIAKLGLIPRTAYFDGTGDLPDIHPTIERMTIGEVYDAGGAGYLPNLNKWSRSQRIDEVVSPIVNPEDHGTSAERGQKYTEDISSHLASLTDAFINNDTVSWTIFTASTIHAGRLTLNFGQEPQPITLATEWTPQLDLKLAVYSGGKRAEFPLTIRQASQTVWQIILPESVSVSGSSAGLVEVRIEGVITNTVPSQDIVGGTFSTDASTTVTGGIEYELSKTFTVTIPQIGFDIEKYAALGNGKTISMKTGMCAGRDFEIKSAKYVSSTDSWLLTLYRSSDEDLGIMFPNADYQIAAGDQYVLLDIAMPDMYVTVASNRLLEAARKLLTDISSERPFYSPQIDAKVVYNESRVLLEGMWMDVAFDSSREYVLVDSITIDENGSNIPTYEVSLRERKGIEWTENVGKSSSSRSSVSVNGGDTEQTGGVRSVGMTVPTGLTVQGSPITGAGIFKVGLAEGYKIPLVSELANYFELATDPTLVQLRQAYSYLGPRKGLIFDANAEADTNADFEKVALPGGGYALHSKLPFYSDSFISAGGISTGGGASAGNATLVAQTYGGTLSATGISPINFYSKERVDQLIAAAGTVQTVAGVSPTSGDIPVASLKSALGLGAAAAYGVGSVASGNTGLVTGGSVYSAINEAVSSVMKMQGTTTTPISDGSTTNPVVIDGSSYTAKKGDVVLYDGKEYLWAGSAWEQLGDEASWALKTTSISAGTGLDGGGTLASNRTISLSAASIASLALADSAYQKPSTGIPQTDLASALSMKIDHGESAYNSLGDYLPLAGGTLSADSANIFNINSTHTSGDNWVYFMVSGTAKASVGYFSGLAFIANENTYSRIGVNDAGVPQYWENTYSSSAKTLYHSGNSNLSTVDWAAKQMTANSFKLASGTPTLTWDSNANAWHLSGNFYADGFISAGGISPGGGTSGIDLAAMWASLTNNPADAYASTKIAAAHIPDMASTYGYLKSTDAVANVDLNGDYLRVTKNGANTDLTIPYATTARYVIGDNNASSPQYALLQSGGGRQDASPEGDTWLFCDTLGGATSPWGIRHNQGDNTIGIIGAGTERILLNMQTGAITGVSFVKTGGTSFQFLKADGSVDSSAYITGITSSMVTAALGYTPANSTSLANYVTLGTEQTITGRKIYHNTAIFNSSSGAGFAEGIRCNLAAASDDAWSSIVLGGAYDSVSGTGEGVWTLCTNNKNFYFGHNGSSYATYGLSWTSSGALNLKTSSLTSNGSTIWTAANDGANSGLDADLLDGQHGSYYAPAASLNNYLPFTGGTLRANAENIFNIDSTYASGNNWIYFMVSGTAKASVGYYSGLAFISNEVTYARIGISDAGEPLYWSSNSWADAHTLYHSGNFNPGDYLPLTGGTLSAAGIPLNLNSSETFSGITFASGGTIFSRLVSYTGDGILRRTDALWSNEYIIYDSGNSNSISVAWSASSLTLNGAITGATTISASSCIFSGAKQSSTSLSTIPADSAVALRTGDGSATGSNTWVWRLNWAYANYGIFWEDNSDVLYFVGDGNSRFNIDFSAGHAQASGSLLAGGSIYLTQGASSAATGYVSAGGGYSQNSGKYGVKIIACDQSDIQSGLGQDCMGDLPYDFSVVGGKSGSYGYISFVFHDANSTTYSRAGYFNQYGDLNVTRNIDSAGTIHSSTGIWSEGYVSAGGLASSSDERLKSGIKDFGYSAEMLMALRPREWDWNEKSYMKGHAAGVVAQELRQVMPYAIVERQYLSVNYDMLHGLEIAGLQDHETRIRQLEAENRELKRRLNMN